MHSILAGGVVKQANDAKKNRCVENVKEWQRTKQESKAQPSTA